MTIMSNVVSGDGRRARSEGSTTQADQYRRKLQRILRNTEIDRQNLSGGRSLNNGRRMTEELKEATLSPKLVNPTYAQEDNEPLFQCTECDMIVKGSDPYCPFCGAIFADGPMAEEVVEEEVIEPEVEAPEAEAPVVETPKIEKPKVEYKAHKEEVVVPEMFDIFSMLKTGSRSKELMYQEASKSFAGSARLLEELEHLVCDIGSLGSDTTRARRLIGSAWEACRDGNWNLAIALARQTEEIVEPNIPDLVRFEVARARDMLTDAKESGNDISEYVLRIKNTMSALRQGDPDEALRLTKELMDSIREDSVSWRQL